MQVVAFSHCLHRNERVFSDPHAFMPDRWLSPGKLETAEEKAQNARVNVCEEWYWTFGIGSRMCLASIMAMERKFSTLLSTFISSCCCDETFDASRKVIRIVVAAVHLHFSTSVEDDANYGIHGGFVYGSAGECLLLKLSTFQKS